MKNIVFLDKSTFPKKVNFPKFKFKNKFKGYDFTESSLLISRIRGAHVIITNKIKLSGKDLSKAPNLELIAITATGTNIIDLEYCKKNNIFVCNLREYASTAVAEHVFALILNLTKKIKGLEEDINKYIWQERKVFALLSHEIFELKGKTLGIIGKGSIGKKVAKIAKAFEMNVLYHSVRKNNHNKLSGFLKKLDILSIHCPLTASTNNLIKSKELNLLKKTAIIINTARGGIVNEDDLVKAIKNGTISGAGIDVTTKEPPNKNHPYYSILKHPNFIWTPHTAWASNETLQEAINQLIDNVNSFYSGKLKNIVK